MNEYDDDLNEIPYRQTKEYKVNKAIADEQNRIQREHCYHRTWAHVPFDEILEIGYGEGNEELDGNLTWPEGEED